MVLLWRMWVLVFCQMARLHVMSKRNRFFAKRNGVCPCLYLQQCHNLSDLCLVAGHLKRFDTLWCHFCRSINIWDTHMCINETLNTRCNRWCQCVCCLHIQGNVLSPKVFWKFSWFRRHAVAFHLPTCVAVKTLHSKIWQVAMHAEIRQMDMKIMKVRMDGKVMKLQCEGLWVRRLEIYRNILNAFQTWISFPARPSDFQIFSAMVAYSYFLMEAMQSEWDVHHLCDAIYALVFPRKLWTRKR